MMPAKWNWKTLAAVAAVVLCAPFAVTCEHGSPEALMITDVMAMTAAQQCTIRPGQAAQAIVPYGRLDLMQTNQYWMYPRFKNMMNPLSTLTGESLQSPEVEGHYMSVQRAKVYVDMGEFTPAEAPNQTAGKIREKYMIGGVESFVAAGVAPLTEGVVAVQAIPPELGNLLDTKMQALIAKTKSPQVWTTIYVSVYGETQTGEVVKSNEFSFPVMLCWGCLVAPTCAEQTGELPCYIGQDEPITAKLCPFVANHPDDCAPDCQ
jgi:hypothetical protein